MKKIILLIAIAILFGCEEDETLVTNGELIGYWINPIDVENTTTFERSQSLKENDYCIGFNSGNCFIQRANSGWCGTPPIAYADYEGTWTETDSVINIQVEYWGGIAKYKWKIETLTETTLKVTRIE